MQSNILKNAAVKAAKVGHWCGFDNGSISAGVRIAEER